MTETQAPKCPYSDIFTLPSDSTPSVPSPKLLALQEAGASPLLYRDGHQGLIVAQYDLAKEILADPRFSQEPQRFPVSDLIFEDELVDERAKESAKVADLLALDGEQHLKIRKTLTARFALNSLKNLETEIQSQIDQVLEKFSSSKLPRELHEFYSEPISVLMHSLLLGIPSECQQEYASLYTGDSSAQTKWNFVRNLLELKKLNLADDLLSDLIASELTPLELEGITFVLLISGRDSIAYFITTSAVNILSLPDGVSTFLEAIEKSPIVIEELLRFGSMFISLFPRTATENLTIQGLDIAAGTSVSVSQVAANRDPRRFSNPDTLNLGNIAAGHLSFSHGIHACVGQQFARIVLRKSLGSLFLAFPDMELISAEQNTPMHFAHPVAVYEAGKVLVGLDVAQ
jgi:cytochrome P450